VARNVDAVVVGGGIVGSAIAFELTRRQRRVFVCEQGRTPGRGATGWSGGLVRQHHTAHCDTRLAVRSLPTFQRWSDVVGGECGYRRTGFVVIVAGHHRERLEQNVAAVNRAGGANEVVEVAQLAASYPALAFDDAEDEGLVAAYEPEAGYVDARAATTSLAMAAVRGGARYGEGVVATGMTVSGDRVTGVETNVGPISAAVVILAAGAWSARLTAPVGVELPLETRRIGLVHAAVDAGDRLPCGIDDALGTYFRPDGVAGGIYFGASLDPVVSLDEHPVPVSASEVAAARKTLGVRVPEVAAAAVDGARAGFDGYTPDEHPAIGPAGPEGLYLCAGFSGGGVKLAPAVAEAVADEICDDTGSDLLEPYRPQRFTSRLRIESDHAYDYLT
jgi:sarcosine oxidase, subunit beta